MQQTQSYIPQIERAEILIYLDFLRRWWWALLLSVVLFGAAGYGAAQYLPKVYKATTTLIVGRPINETGMLSREEIESRESLARSYAALAVRQPILETVVTALELPQNWEDLREQVSIGYLEGTQLLEISAEGSTPARSAAIANEIARQIITMSPAALQNQNQSEIKFIEERLENLRDKIEIGQAKIVELESVLLTDTSKIQETQAEIDALESLITDWDSTYSRFLQMRDEAGSLNRLTIFSVAEAATEPIRPNTLMLVIFSGMLGCLLTTALLILRRLTDDSLRSDVDMQRYLGLDLLGTIGLQGRRRLREEYLFLGGRLQFILRDQKAHSFIVTSTFDDEGKSNVAANLAIEMSRAGYNTILVDADLYQPTIHNAFQILPNTRGLAQLLRGEMEIEPLLRQTTWPNLRILLTGETLQNPAKLFELETLEPVINMLETMADVVILNCSPVLNNADAATLSGFVDRSILVIRYGTSHADKVRQAIQRLQQGKGNLLGGILYQATSHVDRF